jgi:hypothetical protein
MIHKFKEHNPGYVLPNSIPLKDGRRSIDDHWYHIYFYYPEENAIVKTWTRPISGSKTTFAFVGINIGANLGNWKFVNKDFSHDENDKQKRLFEERILHQLGITK